MGLFPNPGQNVYLITPPFFPSVSIRSPLTGKTAMVVSENFDPSYTSIYIQNATVDGIPYTKNWIDHSFFTEGKRLVLRLGASESTWGTRLEDLPPSLSEYTGASNVTVNGTVGLQHSKRWFDGSADSLDLSSGVL
jgi:putative alpha-1,2-mannosidase